MEYLKKEDIKVGDILECIDSGDGVYVSNPIVGEKYKVLKVKIFDWICMKNLISGYTNDYHPRHFKLIDDKISGKDDNFPEKFHWNL
jgi:hypothetical protein